MPILMVVQVLWIYLINKDRPGTADYQYFPVMIVVYMNVNLRPDFRFALCASLLLLVVYAGALTLGTASISTTLIGAASMGAAIYLTLNANWRMERDARYAFILGLRDRLLRQQAEVEADRDPLTGLYNRRFLRVRLDSHTALAIRLTRIMTDAA